MKFTIKTIAESVATHFSSLLPGVKWYEDPNQQGTQCPCAFLQLMSSDVKLRLSGRLLRTLRFDLTHLEDYNLPDLQRRYQEVQEIIDENFETFEYADGSKDEYDKPVTTILRTYNRQASIDLDGLHYKFDLQIWLDPEEDENFMASAALFTEVKDGSKQN